MVPGALGPRLRHDAVVPLRRCDAVEPPHTRKIRFETFIGLSRVRAYSWLWGAKLFQIVLASPASKSLIFATKMDLILRRFSEQI